MKKKIKVIFGIIISILIITGIGIGTYFIAFMNAEDPSFELPVHNLENVTGIQVYHDNRSTQLHIGFDFKLEEDEEIFSPISGTVSNIKKQQMSNGYWMIVVNININMRWEMFIAFEPWTQNESVIDLQLLNITVKQGDYVAQNQSIGLLNPVAGSEFPHIHWSIIKDGEFCSPYDYCSPNAKSQMDWLCDKFGKFPEDS